jgi:hypothetical protein
VESKGDGALRGRVLSLICAAFVCLFVCSFFRSLLDLWQNILFYCSYLRNIQEHSHTLKCQLDWTRHNSTWCLYPDQTIRTVLT